jgi:hypothetical protein
MTMAACASDETSLNESLEEEIHVFVEALLNKKEDKLVVEYLDNSKSFTNEGKLNSDIYSFLYNSNRSIGKKSVLDIASSVDYKFKVIWQSESIFTLLITKSKYYSGFDNVEFLENKWMDEYIACEFILKDSRILLYQNVCFAETGGPFPVDYDI